MRTKIVAAFVAGGVLVGAALIASVISSPETARAQEGTDDSDERGPFPRISSFLGEVLDDLVADGTITQDQADAIVAATEEKAEELREEHRELRERLSAILEDGVITEAEVSELPDDHWLFGDAFDEAWEDGQLTTEELRELRPHRWGRGFRHGLRFGAFLDDGGIDQEEYDSLPEGHPLREIDVSEYLEDGLITPDEFRQIFSDLKDSLRGEDA